MRGFWRAALGFGLSAAFLYLALRGMHLADVGRHLRESSILLWGAVIVVSFLTFPLRALRWRAILDPVAHAVPYGPLWRSVAIGMMVNNVVPPGRLGELARAYVLSREEPRVPFATGIASLVVDRTFDAIIVLMLWMVAILDPAFGTETALAEGVTLGAAAMLAGGGIVIALAALYATVFAPKQMESFAGAAIRLIAPRWEERLRQGVRRFADGLRVLRDPRRFGIVTAWTLAHWLVNALAFWIGFRAVGIDVPFSGALFVQGVIVVGVALPASPGFIGIFEAAARIGLAVYLIPDSLALAWGVAYHLLTFIPITLVGFWHVARRGFTLGELKHSQPPAPSRE